MAYSHAYFSKMAETLMVSVINVAQKILRYVPYYHTIPEQVRRKSGIDMYLAYFHAPTS